MVINKSEMTRSIKMKGFELGFSKVGVTTADDFTEYEAEVMNRPDYAPWLNTEKSFYVAKGARPRSFFPVAKSIVCTTYSYGDILYPKELSKYVAYAYQRRAYMPLKDSICGIRVEAFKNYLMSIGCNVYTGKIAVPARRACARAGIVNFGKNNFAYTDEDGSFIILYTFIIDTELEYDEPSEGCRCPPNCKACIEACPTKALAPGNLQPLKCLLFNHMGTHSIPNEIREGMGTSIHGCDICQKACPRNKEVLSKATKKDYFLEKLEKVFDIEKVLLMDENYYKDVVYPIMHNYIEDKNYFRRNAAIAMGNSGEQSHIPALMKVLKNENFHVREAAQWAINKLRINSTR